MTLTRWQWLVLSLPIASVIAFLLIAAGWQIHDWGLSWIWAIFILIFLGWRWLLVAWTRPALTEAAKVVANVSAEAEAARLSNSTSFSTNDPAIQQLEATLNGILEASRGDRPIWEDWPAFWSRCQDVVVAVARVYHPEVKYPLLNIYVPQAYGLIRGTVDDMDYWMNQLSPVLQQVTVGQAYQAYELYQTLEPSARKLLQIWNWAQWVLNPAAAVARTASQKSSDRATQQLLGNLSQLLREAALRNLCQQAIALYSGNTLPPTLFANPENQEQTPALPTAKTQTLREILEQAEPVEQVQQQPVNLLLVGRTGAGKSSVINTLFQSELAEVDVLPSTDQVQNYQWSTELGIALNLWDTPGYEQVEREDLREQVLDYATTADLLLLISPALDPSLQMDVDFLQDLQAMVADLPTIAIVTQVDRLRPIREWQPPYNWQTGDRPKEQAIRDATDYRTESLDAYCTQVLPLVTQDTSKQRPSWNADQLATTILEAIDSAKQLRLARFLRNQEARSVAAAKIIDRYTRQMATTQGLTALLKSPVLKFISTLTTGSPTLAYLLAEQIPVEQLPVVIGKLQMAYDLFSVLSNPKPNGLQSDEPTFNLLTLWPLLLDNPSTPDRDAWAFGHALVEYWTQSLTVEQLKSRFDYYLNPKTTLE